MMNSAPFDAPQVLRLAEKARRRGDLAQAAGMFSDVLVRFPANRKARQGVRTMGGRGVQALSEKARQLEASGALSDAEQHWARALALRVDHVGLGLSLARCQLDLGRASAALATVDQVLSHHPDDPVAWDTKGRALRDLGQIEAANSAHLKALGHGELDAGPLNHLGILAQASGDKTAAQDYFQRALTLAPDQPDLHQNLSRSLNYTADHPHLGQMQDALERTDPDAAAPLHFALFNAYDKLNDTATAFAHLTRANTTRKAALGYELQRDAIRFAFNKVVFENSPPVMSRGQDTDLRPIFVVGLPRSGTTLVERILAQSKSTHAAGELAAASHAIAPLLRQMKSETRQHLTQQDLIDLRTRLLKELKAHSTDTPVLIDKMPLNFRWMGFLCAALPEARIVHIQRDPMAVAWSLYKHAFAGRGNGFAYDFADIVGYMLLHRDLTQFWHNRFPEQIAPLSYRDLIDNTQATTQSLAKAVDLEWHPDWTTPQKHAATVLTASADQVRQPIYKGSDGEWTRYGAFLKPVRDAIEAAGLNTAAFPP
ncbi:MAG: sulfotransferase [Sedimentitalea sp.]